MAQKWKISALAGVALGAVLLGAAGLYTNGIQTVVPGTNYSVVNHLGLLPVDTALAGGVPPQTVAATAFQIAAVNSELIVNQATAAGGAVTLVRRAGLITTDSLTTAVGGTYVLTLSDSLILAGNTQFQAGVYSGTNGTPGALSIQSIVVTAGQAVITILNTGNAALSGTLVVPFHI